MSALDPNEMRAMETACAEHDALMREAAVAKVIRKVHAPEPEPEPAPPPAAPAAPWRDDSVLTDAVADFVAQMVGEERERTQRELDSARAELDSARGELTEKVIRLQAQLDVLLALVRPEPKPQKAGGEVVDVPQLTWRN